MLAIVMIQLDPNHEVSECDSNSGSLVRKPGLRTTMLCRVSDMREFGNRTMAKLREEGHVAQ